MSSRARSVAMLIAILLVAAILRLVHLHAGVPYAVGVDEPEIMERVVRMMKTGDFNPHFFDWPSLAIYLHLVVACVTFLVGSMQGAWSNLDQVTAADFYLTGRAMTASLGTGTVLLTFLAARRWGTLTALVAAALMAVMPYHVRESHFALADVPTAFFTTLAFVLSLRALERPSTGAFAWAGAAVGLAASCKYNGAVAIVMPAIAVVVSSPLERAPLRVLLVGTAAGGAFLIGTPYALLDLPGFLNDYARLAAVFARDRAGEPGWLIYLKHLRGSLAWPGLVLGAVGLLLGLRHWAFGPARTRWALLVAFPALYFAVMATSFQIYGRYTLPLLPFACIFIAVGVGAMTTLAGGLRLPRVSAAATATTLLIGTLAVPTTASIDFNRTLGRTSTVDRAYRWIRDNVERGTKIAIETRVLLLPKVSYPSVNLPRLTEKRFEDYAAESFRYLVASTDGYEVIFESPAGSDNRFPRYRELLSRATQVAVFHQEPEQPGPTLRIFRLDHGS